MYIIPSVWLEVVNVEDDGVSLIIQFHTGIPDYPKYKFLLNAVVAVKTLQ